MSKIDALVKAFTECSAEELIDALFIIGRLDIENLIGLKIIIQSVMDDAKNCKGVQS